MAHGFVGSTDLKTSATLKVSIARAAHRLFREAHDLLAKMSTEVYAGLAV